MKHFEVKLIKIERIQRCSYCLGTGILTIKELNDTVPCFECHGERIERCEDTLTIRELKKLLAEAK